MTITVEVQTFRTTTGKQRHSRPSNSRKSPIRTARNEKIATRTHLTPAISTNQSRLRSHPNHHQSHENDLQSHQNGFGATHPGGDQRWPSNGNPLSAQRQRKNARKWRNPSHNCRSRPRLPGKMALSVRFRFLGRYQRASAAILASPKTAAIAHSPRSVR
jgi:hypothetical protein